MTRITIFTTNWWAKLISTHPLRTYGGLIVALAPLLFACEDDDFLSLPADPGESSLSLRYVRIPVPFTIVQLDSLDTSPKPNNSKQLLAGSFSDTDFGVATAASYLDFSAAGSNTVSDTAQYQSLELELRYVRSYGTEQEATQSLSVLPLTQRFDDSTVYYNTSELRTGPNALGDIAISTKLTGGADTLRFRLDDALGQQIFNLAQSGDTTVTSNSLFREFFPGLVLAPSADNQFVSSFDPSGTRLIMNFTNPSGEPREMTFTIRRFFNQIAGDFAGTALADVAPPGEGIVPADSNLYLQSGTGVAPVISVDSAVRFIRRQESDTSNVLINRAELNIGLRNVGDTLGMPVALFAYQLAVDSLGRLDRVRVRADDRGNSFYQGLNSDQNPFVPGIPPEAAPLVLDSTRYRISVTNYLTNFVNSEATPPELYLWANNYESSLSRLVTPADSVYLNIYYTVRN